jgi:cell division inhibitor SepF
MNFFQRVWDSFSFSEQYDDGDYDYEYGDEAFNAQSPTMVHEQPMMMPPHAQAQNPRGMQHPQPPAPSSNVIGMPNRLNGVSEVIILQPRSFEEIPQAVSILRERKSVILNMMNMDPDQAQRSVDFVAGGVFAIDGHQERLGENIFLFTPNVVQITAHASAQPSFNPPVPSMHPPSMSHISPTIHPPENQFRMQ